MKEHEFSLQTWGKIDIRLIPFLNKYSVTRGKEIERRCSWTTKKLEEIDSQTRLGHLPHGWSGRHGQCCESRTPWKHLRWLLLALLWMESVSNSFESQLGSRNRSACNSSTLAPWAPCIPDIHRTRFLGLLGNHWSCLHSVSLVTFPTVHPQKRKVNHFSSGWKRSLTDYSRIGFNPIFLTSQTNT